MTDLSPYGKAAPAARRGDSLVDILDRVLDKGVVIAGDVRIQLLDIELLTLRIRLLIASVDKAREMGIDWWGHDPYLSHGARQDEDEQQRLAQENRMLRERLERLEGAMNRMVEQGATRAAAKTRTGT